MCQGVTCSDELSPESEAPFGFTKLYMEFQLIV